MRIGVIPNLRKPELAEALGILFEWAGGTDTELLLSARLSEHPDAGIIPDGMALVPETQIAAEAEYLLAMGGDGTILAALRHAGERGIPVLGVNLGSLGFLADIQPESMSEGLDRLAAGKFEIEERMTLEAELRSAEVPGSFVASNEVVVDKGEYSRVIDIDVEVDGRFLNRYTADGALVSTPTGSTAYALAAGGPILEPTMDALVVVPISPHTLAVRPLVLPADCTVELKVQSKHGTALVTWDGQERVKANSGDTVVVRRGDRRNRLVRTGLGLPFYQILREKLKWGFREPAERS